jgi:hypothetical protein
VQLSGALAPDFLFNLKPTAMYTLLKTGLLLFFRESDLPTVTVSEAHLSELFEKFIEELIDYSSDEHRSIIERLRCMNFTHKQLSLLEEQKHTATEHLITDYMKRTLFLIDMEIRLLNLRLQYPQSGIVPKVKIESPLYLSKELTVTDLVELLYALHLIEAFRKSDGSRIEFSVVIHTFEEVLHIRIKNYERFKNAAINRKIRLTGFLDQLKAALTERSQR